MTGDLETKVLSPGIYAQVGDRSIPVSKSFIDEVRRFSKSRNGSHGADSVAELPFVNQYRPCVQLVRALATE